MAATYISGVRGRGVRSRETALVTSQNNYMITGCGRVSRQLCSV